MRLIGEKSRGATLDTTEQTECLAEFNTFMDACANERLLCYQVQQDSKALTASTASYTIGTNGAFAVTRPTKIVDPCFIRDSASGDSPLKIIGAEEYGRIVSKSVGFTYPTHLFYDYGYSATSTGTIYLYPSPSTGLTLYINSWKQLGTVSTLSQQLMLPPGYQLFLESNFALHLAAGLVPVSPELAKIARDSKVWIKTLNSPEQISRLDAGLVSPSSPASILTGP